MALIIDDGPCIIATVCGPHAPKRLRVYMGPASIYVIDPD